MRKQLMASYAVPRPVRSLTTPVHARLSLDKPTAIAWRQISEELDLLLESGIFSSLFGLVYAEGLPVRPMDFDFEGPMTRIQAAALALHQELSQYRWFISVGITQGVATGDFLMVYVTNLRPLPLRTLRDGYEGFAVELVKTTRPRPA